MLSKDKITEIFYIADDFCKEYKNIKSLPTMAKSIEIGIVPCLTVR